MSNRYIALECKHEMHKIQYKTEVELKAEEEKRKQEEAELNRPLTKAEQIRSYFKSLNENHTPPKVNENGTLDMSTVDSMSWSENLFIPGEKYSTTILGLLENTSPIKYKLDAFDATAENSFKYDKENDVFIGTFTVSTDDMGKITRPTEQNIADWKEGKFDKIFRQTIKVKIQKLEDITEDDVISENIIS